jgi:hypothetical protein
MLNAIYSFHLNWDKLNSITNKEFYGKIFPGKPYSNKTLRNRLNELTVVAKKFIVMKESENEESQNNLMLLKGLRERKRFGLFRSEFEKINNEIDKDSSKSHYNSEIKLLSAYVYLENQDYKKTFESFRNHTDYKLTYYLENIFEMMLEFESEKQYDINTKNNIAYDLINNFKTDNFIKTIEQKNDVSYLFVLLYYYLYKSFKDLYDERSYKKFYDLFFKNLNVLSYEQKNAFFDYMISRYFSITNSGKPEYLKEVFKLYDIKLKLGLHSELKSIRYPSTAYRDYIVVGLKLKKFKWVEEFIQKYSDELPLEIRDDEINMAYARLYMFKKEYLKAIKLLNSKRTSNYIYTLDASRIKLRCYYEITDFENAFLEIDRIKHYIKNNTKKIALSVRKYSKEFLDIYNELLKLKLSPDKKEIGYLLKNIQNSGILPFKDWLSEKIKEMK